MAQIEWFWRHEGYYGRCVESARAGRAVWELDVRGCLFSGPAILSPRLSRMIRCIPEPARVDRTDVTRSVARCVDRVLTRYAGVHRSTMLIDVECLPIPDGCGAVAIAEITVIWQGGQPTLFAKSEVRIDEHFYSEKILLLTELRHMCQDE